MELRNRLGLKGLEFQREEERISKQKAKRLYDSKEYTLSEIRDLTGVSYSTLYRYISSKNGA